MRPRVPMMAVHGTSPINIILVCWLCDIESLCHFYLCNDRLIKFRLLFCNKVLCYSKLFLSRTPNAATVLSANVRALAIYLSRIMDLKKSLKKLQVWNFLWVEGNSHCLSMPSLSIANFIISRVKTLSLLIATLCTNDSRSFFKCVFDPPEASSSEICDFVATNLLGMFLSRTFHR